MSKRRGRARRASLGQAPAQASAAPHALGLRPLCLPRELAAWLRVSPRTVRRRMLEGMPHKNIGGLVRFDPDEVMEWLNRQSGRERKA